MAWYRHCKKKSGGVKLVVYKNILTNLLGSVFYKEWTGNAGESFSVRFRIVQGRYFRDHPDSYMFTNN